MISVLLIDDHKIVRQGISAALKKNRGIKIIGEGGDGLEAVELTKKLNPGLIIMDINMPRLDGIEAAKEIRKFNSKVKILILTMLEDKHYILDALSADINGYLFKLAGLDELSKAIEVIVSGENYFDQKITKTLVDDTPYRMDEDVLLSPRELDVLKQIAKGMTSNEIGDSLFISPHTVKKHRKNIIKKLNVHGTAELVKYSIEHKLI